MRFIIAIFFATVASFFSDASAIPVQPAHLKARAAFPGPPITNPTNESILLAGQQLLVTWDASEVDTDSDASGPLRMGQKGPGGIPELTILLASGVFLVNTNITVVIPSGTPDGKYIMALSDDTNVFFQSVSDEFSISGLLAGAPA